MNKKSAHARISCSLQKHAEKNFKDEKKSLPHNIFPQYFLSLISLTWTSFETQCWKCQSPLRLCWLIQSCCGKLEKWTKESAHARVCARMRGSRVVFNKTLRKSSKTKKVFTSSYFSTIFSETFLFDLNKFWNTKLEVPINSETYCAHTKLL